MITINNLETYITTEKNLYGSFLIEPLEIGQGITLGNSLRRTLLSDLNGFSITGIRINNIKHSFEKFYGLREDLLELILNLKEIIFKSAFSNLLENNNLKYKAFLNIKGPIIITAGMLHLPKNVLKILNPNQYIGTLINKTDFYLELDIEYNNGYQLIEDIKPLNIIDNIYNFKPYTLSIDSIFIPIKNINYKIQLIHDNYGNIKESLIFEIVTNGSISPKRSLKEAIKILLNLLYPLLLSLNFLNKK
jgi:DNA-directed RNA polymerase subunit alpha